jgi:hypothetical protein
MTAAQRMIISIAIACTGCAPEGQVVQVSVKSQDVIAGVQHLLVNAKVTTLTKAVQTRSYSFDIASGMTPFSFGIATPQSLVGASMNVTVDLLDGPGDTLASGSGDTLIGVGVTPLVVNVSQPSRCAGANIALPYCDGFEGTDGSGGFATFWTLPPALSGGDATIDSTHVRRGNSALHLSNNGVGDGGAPAYAIVGTKKPLPADLFVRAFVYVPSGFDRAPGAIFLFEQAQAPYAQVALNLDTNAFSIYDSIDGTLQHAAGVAIRNDDWMCLEWEVHGAASSPIKMWVDDQPVAGLGTPVSTTPPAGEPLDEVAVGLLSNVAGTRGREIWIDEVMIDAMRITCAR